jgi:hypothetical protein
MLFDPGVCAVCGADHCTCRATPAAPVTVSQLPARDARTAAEAVETLIAEEIQATLPPGQFTSGTYRRPKKA